MCRGTRICVHRVLEELRGTKGHRVTTFYLADFITCLLPQAIQTKLEDGRRNLL
jgi:hypothetical protein